MQRVIVAAGVIGVLAASVSAVLTVALAEALAAEWDLLPILVGQQYGGPSFLVIMVYGVFGYLSAVAAQRLSGRKGWILWLPVGVSGMVALVSDILLCAVFLGSVEAVIVRPKVIGLFVWHIAGVRIVHEW